MATISKKSGEKIIKELTEADEKAIALAQRFGYSLPNAYKSLGSALKTLIDKTPSKRQRTKYEARLSALKRSANKAKGRSNHRNEEAY
ncbi:FIG017608: hypothetical membrane protein,specific for cyanobacteria [Richelia intracellularis HH01]|uniref:FIG017608: hypothetical membrane protein,specific for cyanobacteria n=1 Tax=Richelia intracellularis HH01 TaxID=1165094 RepID=M1WSL6_9NOST|nr:FIG017608: hypothetical membrane protein,specific for cyanobacteria [Richelia intracellularis HH01]